MREAVASWVAADAAKPGAAYRWADWRDDDVAGRCAALAAEHALFAAPLLEVGIVLDAQGYLRFTRAMLEAYGNM